MSISMEKFASDGQFASFDSHPKTTQAIRVFSIQCRCCGFEPDDAVVSPKICPKCHSRAWERFAKPGSILQNADRYVA
jgi:Zn finger protein HypA/HybF involved in hydrogenase expression